MANFKVDNVYYIQDSSGTALGSWPTNAKVNSIIFVANNTLASAQFQIYAGTPFLSWGLLVHGAVSVGSAAAIVHTPYQFDFRGQNFGLAFIPTTLTACSAWITFGPD